MRLADLESEGLAVEGVMLEMKRRRRKSMKDLLVQHIGPVLYLCLPRSLLRGVLGEAAYLHRPRIP